MKYLLMAVLTGFFVISPAFAEGDDAKRDERRERIKERRERKPGKKSPGPWKILQSISSEERTRLRQLHATDPAAYKTEIAKIVKRIRQEKRELNEKVRKLVHQYKNSEDAEKKKETLKQLRTIIRKIFMDKMRKNKKRLESLEKHVKIVRRKYNFRQKNADKIIQSRLDKLTSDTKFDW